MEFETVYKIGELHEDGQDNFFLKKDDLNRIVQQQEYKLLYFLRKSNYKTFHDYPALGASTTIFKDSSIDGPFVSPPQTKEKKSYEDYEVIKGFIPSDKFPDYFKDIELVDYGIQTGPDFVRTVSSLYSDGINFDKIKEIGESAIDRLKSVSQSFKEVRNSSRFTYNASINGCAVELYYSEAGFFYPFDVRVKIFGEKEKPQEIVKELGLHLETIIENKYFFLADEVLERSVRRGLAYNLSIQNIKEISEVKDMGNIIL